MKAMMVALAGAAAMALGCQAQDGLEVDTTESGLAQFGTVIDLATGDDVPGAFSKIRRRSNKGRLEFKVKSTVDPMAAYTLWLCGFDDPSQCDSNPCSLDELLGGVGESFCQWGAGDIANVNNGKIILEGHSAFTTQTILGDGLDNIDGAEIHLVLRTHEGASATDLGAQLTDFNGGCPPATCSDTQASIILAP